MRFMELNQPTVTLLSIGLVLAGFQLWWISSLVARNRRIRGGEPLSSKEFKKELDRIFSNNVHLK